MKKIIVFTGLMALVCLTSCTSKKEEKEEVEKFTVTNPVKIDTSFTKEYVSQIKSVRNIELRAQEKGFLQNIYVDEGQFVKKGQLLFKIMPNMYEAELLKAQSEQKSAEIELQNSKLLADKNIVSKNELSVAQAKLQSAKAEVSLARLHLSFTEIRAPFDGTIDRIPLKLGSLIDEGELLTSLSDNSQMFAYFNVSEPEYLQYETNIKDRADNKVALVLANGDIFKDKGNVEVIESEFNNETGNIAFRARFPNSGKLLRNGETGQVQMNVPLKNAIVIPQKATYEIQDKKYVFVVGKDDKVSSREITITGEIPDLYVIKSGISENDRILLEGVQKVKENDKIKYDYQSPKEVMNHLRLKAE
ncbi:MULTISPECIES: efflux RND transporter periplasmic adaptor subunit [Flavobacterium]|jgi:membrane fusion protein (multidrug efflux system)|uniref:Efflux transporter, RND family, MFP subunit n=2 Tax=Flavobacterium johnsoniae TaxID=986 RepID=A5FAB1_FLAJ1|nr:MULTISPECIES: efflux RND transporter periplasmic adaptor subunit [Flavobacterium]ABQ07862.1 efflux transporter, RND family, MFP subunit [Flavobacterium johnsoniae UW101]OXG01945.1 efflux transporter periplasmic adaptor subunit [Flavobacterium johnsoniae UW101]WDF58608.1 efflux RND transporter periplasmic adaptor subunit [Flavobacterium sp. KACC 22758]WQG80293.1 efflux RND transporter periplasmic adaptor subunit [Flavobacterium johnsoniae UW101]SHK99503.1 membrane fusion protein, multidrug e